MKNKQKAWRTSAAKFKQATIAAGDHIHGVRYGRALKQVFIRILPHPSPLLERMLASVGVYDLEMIE